ncbi:Toll/interleukin-1 receptor domain-containing protein [Tanacetum coccineum]
MAAILFNFGKLEKERLAPKLEELTIDYCKDFGDLHIPADRHSKLKYITLQSSKLTSLHLGNTLNLKKLILRDGHLRFNKRSPRTPNLKTLDLGRCNNLVELQMPAESLNLELLNLKYSKLTNLHLGNTPNLKTLVLEGCNDLVQLQLPAESLKLEHLDLTHSKLTNLHLGNTPNLKKLELSHSKLKTIHLGSTRNLETLILEGSNDLVELKMPDDKFQMSAKSLNLKHLKISHSKLKTLHLGSTPNLEKLILDGCNDLVEFQMPAESLMLEELYPVKQILRTLDHGLLQITKFVVEGVSPFVYDKELDSDEVGIVYELNLNAEPTDVCPLHCDNDFLKFQFSCYVKDQASSFGNFERLISIGFCASINHESFSRSISSLQGIKKLTLEGSLTEAPWDLDQLECLEELIFSSTKIRDLPDSICKLKHLKSFKIRSCWLLEKLPTDIGRLESLEKLILNDFVELPEDIGFLEGLKELNIQGTGITRLPDSICKLKHLKSFKIKSCWLLEKLPEDIGRLESLEKLILRDCKLLQDIPNSICKVNCIKKLSLRGCIRVVELPEDIGCLEALGGSHEPEAISNQRTTGAE